MKPKQTDLFDGLADAWSTWNARYKALDGVVYNADLSNEVRKLLAMAYNAGWDKSRFEFARSGGTTMTEKKRLAVRENGKKGGRPRKVPAPI